jgi:hypothetical protein
VAEHPNVELQKRLAKAFRDRDVDALREIFAEDVVWRVGGRNAIAGEYRGVGEILAFFARVGELSGGTYRIELDWVLADDRRGASLYRATGRRDGRAIDIVQVGVLLFENGRVADVSIIPFDQHAFDEFWA